MRGLRRPRGAIIQREFQYFTRAFPAKYVVIHRETPVYGTKGQRLFGQGPKRTIYQGEAVVIPSSGQVQHYGGGQTEQFDLALIIQGKRDIEQGDFLYHDDGRVYIVEYAPSHHEHFIEVRLKQYRQTIP